jgi:hypothetical protein
MKTPLQTHLATLAPLVCISTSWGYDDDADRSIFHAGNALENEHPRDWECWAVEITATTIHNGELVSGSAHLGGTWERQGDDPSQSNPEISGYEKQMTVEALEDLQKQLPDTHVANYQITATLAALSE